MARRHRYAPAGSLHHVCNRGSRKGLLFYSEEDYIVFVRLVAEARSTCPIRILAYCLMSNHWHFLLWPESDGDLQRFMHWLTGVHAQRWREARGTQGEGAVYQSRYQSVAIEDSWHLHTTWRYVERNPVEAHLVARAEEWPWSSAARQPPRNERLELDPPPAPLPHDWRRILHEGFDLALDVDSV
jgi:putative transposase